MKTARGVTIAAAILAIACSGPSVPSPSTPVAATITPLAATLAPVTAGPATSRPPLAQQACAYSADSADYQLAYAAAGMDTVEVTCGIEYKDVDGVKLTLDLYLPPDTEPGDRLPAVVLVHGNGGLSNPLQPINDHWERDMFTHGLAVAASGMAAIAPAYRGYTAADADSLAAAQQDVLDVLTYIEGRGEQLMIDPERMCIWTTSGGGMPGAWATLFGDPQPRCAVIFSATLGTPAAERSPDEFVSADMPPFFIAGGKLDAYARGSQTFIERAIAIGADVTVREHPGGGNGHFEQTADEESAAIIAEAIDFVRGHLEK